MSHRKVQCCVCRLVYKTAHKTSHRFVLQLYVFLFFFFFKKFKFKCFSSHTAVLWFWHKAHLVRVRKTSWFGLNTCLHVLVSLLQHSWRCFQVSLKTQGVQMLQLLVKNWIFLLTKNVATPKYQFSVATNTAADALNSIQNEWMPDFLPKWSVFGPTNTPADDANLCEKHPPTRLQIAWLPSKNICFLPPQTRLEIVLKSPEKHRMVSRKNETKRRLELPSLACQPRLP